MKANRFALTINIPDADAVRRIATLAEYTLDVIFGGDDEPLRDNGPDDLPEVLRGLLSDICFDIQRDDWWRYFDWETDVTSIESWGAVRQYCREIIQELDRRLGEQ